MPEDRDGWLDRDMLCQPDSGPLAALNARMAALGFGANRRAVSASLLLRHGWAAGFLIGAWLHGRVVPQIGDFGLKFSSMTLVEALWVREARIVVPADEEEGRRLLLEALLAFSEPLVASQHGWSRYSRRALWAMIVSSWMAQFAAIGQRLGRRDAAVAEARQLLALDTEIAAAAPDFYDVHVGARSEVCQKRAACCLYHKGPRKEFCVSCPLLSEAERLRRNRIWVRSGDALRVVA
ncbi:(2Fe-2S)-binding protein [Sphingobium cloacae]|uniref:(2Fe-2S)-binding protein n=1 Tax=Sphingobium cloacae TaxID=120107 RepID=UPI000F50CB0B|nr:(2Fe-2S)-binding protein [Sphingobium cloacae]